MGILFLFERRWRQLSAYRRRDMPWSIWHVICDTDWLVQYSVAFCDI